jgi:hypothetical protein
MLGMTCGTLLVLELHLGTLLPARSVARAFHSLGRAAASGRSGIMPCAARRRLCSCTPGRALETVPAILGRSPISVTADVSSHVTSALTAPALNRLDQFLRS